VDLSSSHERARVLTSECNSASYFPANSIHTSCVPFKGLNAFKNVSKRFETFIDIANCYHIIVFAMCFSGCYFRR
jgi:hypothetical protein